MIKFLLVLLFVSKVWAMPIGDQVIAYGPSAGERLIDIAKSYTAPGPDGELIHIPEKAIDDAFEFFD